MSRQELIQNAIAFLADPKTQASPLAQRIQFLEAKGLTPAEIDSVVKQATVNSTAGPQPYQPVYGGFGPVYPQAPWDWRDYFITAVVSGSLAYGAVTLFKKYLVPHLQPPSTTVYEDDRDALNAQFDAAEALLKEIQSETSAIRAAVDEQKERLDKAADDVQAVVKEMREGEVKTRDSMREMREEVDNIRDMIPKMIEKNKESQNQSLSEIQQELKSLKALLLSRGPSVSSIPTSPLPQLASRPSIPAWQLASSTPAANAGSTATPSTPPSVTPYPQPNGKGKEVAPPASEDTKDEQSPT